jgi:hypothetical protein
MTSQINHPSITRSTRTSNASTSAEPALEKMIEEALHDDESE